MLLFTLQPHYDNLARHTEADFPARSAHPVCSYHSRAIACSVHSAKETVAIQTVLYRGIEPEKIYLTAMSMPRQNKVSISPDTLGIIGSMGKQDNEPAFIGSRLWNAGTGIAETVKNTGNIDVTARRVKPYARVAKQHNAVPLHCLRNLRSVSPFVVTKYCITAESSLDSTQCRKKCINGIIVSHIIAAQQKDVRLNPVKAGNKFRQPLLTEEARIVDIRDKRHPAAVKSGRQLAALNGIIPYPPNAVPRQRGTR